MKKLFVCEVEKMENAAKKRFMVKGMAVMIANVEGEFFATQDTCTHAQASMSAGHLHGFMIECPRHGGAFDLRTGEAKILPVVTALKTYKVIVEDGKIYIEMSDEDLKPLSEKIDQAMKSSLGMDNHSH